MPLLRLFVLQWAAAIDLQKLGIDAVDDARRGRAYHVQLLDGLTIVVVIYNLVWPNSALRQTGRDVVYGTDRRTCAAADGDGDAPPLPAGRPA